MFVDFYILPRRSFHLLALVLAGAAVVVITIRICHDDDDEQGSSSRHALPSKCHDFIWVIYPPYTIES
jgi:hypothetical protein